MNLTRERLMHFDLEVYQEINNQLYEQLRPTDLFSQLFEHIHGGLGLRSLHALPTDRDGDVQAQEPAW